MASRLVVGLTGATGAAYALLGAMRVLTDPAETGAVTISLPQDVQAEAFDWPVELFAERTHHVARPPAEAPRIAAAAEIIRSAERPMIVAGGGVHYSGAEDALAALCEATGIPVGETQAGKGSLLHGHPQLLGAVGSTGTTAANAVAAQADVVIGIGTRYQDFTTASRTAFAADGVRFVNLNITPFDAVKHSGLTVVGDAREAITALTAALDGWGVDDDHRQEQARLWAEWDAQVEAAHQPSPEVTDALAEAIGEAAFAAAVRRVLVDRGELDLDALDDALQGDPDDTLTLLVEMSHATDEGLRAAVRRLLGSAFFGSTIDLLKKRENEIAQIGIGRKFQKPTVFEMHSVEDNILLALKSDRRPFPTLLSRRTGEERDRIDALQATLVARGIDCQRVAIDIAAHSRMLEPILGRFGDYLRGDADGWWLRDLGSTNGTRVGLVPLVGEKRLASGSHLILGELDLLVLALRVLEALHHLGGLRPRAHQRGRRRVPALVERDHAVEGGAAGDRLCQG